MRSRTVAAVTVLVAGSLTVTGCRGENAPKDLKGGDNTYYITEDMSGWKYISYGGGEHCTWKVISINVSTKKVTVINEGHSDGKNKKTSVQLFSSSEGNHFVTKGCAPWFRSDQPVEQ